MRPHWQRVPSHAPAAGAVAMPTHPSSLGLSLERGSLESCVPVRRVELRFWRWWVRAR